MNRHGKLGGPAFVLAMIALFVALTGGAVAAGIVPLAKHALTADTATNAKKLGGQTPAQIKASLKGPAGPAGPAGPQGPAGPKGDAGPQGSPGSTGSQGAQGPKGDKGDKGDVGSGLKIIGTVAGANALPQTGTTGDAYLVNGDLYVWTGAAWTNAGPVKGPKGDTGDTGATGPQGIQGIQGIQGAPGTAAVTVHPQAYSLGGGAAALTTANCGANQKAVNGGFDSNGNVFNLDTFPTTPNDDGWTIFLVNGDNTTRSGNVYAICLG
jgi:hypothetical protein